MNKPGYHQPGGQRGVANATELPPVKIVTYIDEHHEEMSAAAIYHRCLSACARLSRETAAVLRERARVLKLNININNT